MGKELVFSTPHYARYDQSVPSTLFFLALLWLFSGLRGRPVLLRIRSNEDVKGNYSVQSKWVFASYVHDSF